MARKLVSSGSSFEAEVGYSRAVVDGDWVFVSGTTGFDYATMTMPDDVVAQCRQAMRNIESALTQAGAAIDDIMRVRYILPRREDFEPCWPVLKEYPRQRQARCDDDPGRPIRSAHEDRDRSDRTAQGIEHVSTRSLN